MSLQSKPNPDDDSAGVRAVALLCCLQAASRSLPKRQHCPGSMRTKEPEQDLSAASLSELSETEAALVTRAIDDLAATTSVDPASISLVSIEPVEWPDASLGCPQPDMMYAQMLTPGYRIVLSTGDETVEYHTATDPDGPVVHCEETE